MSTSPASDPDAAGSARVIWTSAYGSAVVVR